MPRPALTPFHEQQLPQEVTVLAPDGSEVRVLLALAGGSMAHFRRPAGAVSAAVAHRTVEEIWYVVAGAGQMWRRQGKRETLVNLQPGLCLTLPLGTAFQFRAAPDQALEAVAVTLPPWPGPDEAYAVEGPWAAQGDSGSPPQP